MFWFGGVKEDLNFLPELLVAQEWVVVLLLHVGLFKDRVATVLDLLKSEVALRNLLEQLVVAPVLVLVIALPLEDDVALPDLAAVLGVQDMSASKRL